MNLTGLADSLREDHRKLLIVERNLVANAGHHHTQVTALKDLLPRYDTYFLAGESYDGFMGEASGKLDIKTIALARLRLQMRHGSSLQRASAALHAVRSGRLRSLPASAFGQTLFEVSKRLDLGPQDLIVVPAADLDALESSIELSALLGRGTPQVYHRFLTADLGEKNNELRKIRLNSISLSAHMNIHLFCETEELATHVSEKLGLNAAGGFYLPCSIEVQAKPVEAVSSGRFRVGVLGLPKKRKGSSRIAAIVASTVELAKGNLRRPVEFVIQGSAHDFHGKGVYASLSSFVSGDENVSITPKEDRISPSEFRQLFNSTDLILLPYDRSVYGLQGSGMIQDAVAAFKPIVHSEGLSMKRFLCHGNAVAATTDMEFAQAILRIAADPTRFRAGTVQAASFFDSLLKNHPLVRTIGDQRLFVEAGAVPAG